MSDRAPAGRAASYALVALLAMGSAACGDTEDPVTPTAPGSISVTTETSGFMKDDGYELLVDGEGKGAIGANDEMTVSELDPATYEVTLADVAENCAVDGLSVPVVSDQTAEVALVIGCVAPDPTAYTLRPSRDRPKLATGEIVSCSFGICPSEAEWDLWVYYDSQTEPHSVIRQNQETGVEIAHVAGVVLDELTEEDVAGATFTTDLVAEPFDADRVILIKTEDGSVYALGNPVEIDTAQTQNLSFDAVLIIVP